MKKWLLGLLLLIVSPLIYAHPSHGSGLFGGFFHPFTGLDHFLVMLPVGLWAGKMGGASKWQAPLTFLVFMAAGATLGASGFSVTLLEGLLAISVIYMGVLLTSNIKPSSMVSLFTIGSFAIFHGIAHGSEMMGQNFISTLTGMLVASAILHSLGLWLSNSSNQVIKTFGWGMVSVGTYLLAS